MTRGADPWDDADAIQRVLFPGEVLLWSGKPHAPRDLDLEDVRFIIIGAYCALAYWGAAFFGLQSSSLLVLRVLPSFAFIAFFAIVRPVIRRQQRRTTVFALTPSRALVIQGAPSTGLEMAAVPAPMQVWRREDGDGSVIFETSPYSTSPTARRGVGVLLQVILFISGMASWPFPDPWKRGRQLTFYEVDDVDQLVQTLESHGLSGQTSSSQTALFDRGRWSGLAERGFTPARRTLCAALGVVLVVATVPLIAVRVRDYLQHSPTLSIP